MNKTLEKYLNSVDKYLKPLPALERADIIKEIESSILEMENDICSIFAGALLIAVGVGAWKLLIHYIKAVSKTKRHLSV